MAHSALYIRIMNSSQWQRLSREIKAERPFCEECLRKSPPMYRPSQCVHHIQEIESASARTDEEAWQLATSRQNLSALCFECHAAIHAAKRSHSREAHRKREQERLQRWITRHTEKRNNYE